MRVAALQTDIVWEDPAANFAAVAPQIARAAAAGARLVVLPEMFACGFSMNAARIAEADDGATASFLCDQARAHGVWVAGSFPRRGAPRPTNTLLLAGPGGERHRYAKIHPFTFAGEHEHYAPGSEFVSVTVEGVRVTLFVCYDLRFADEFWNTASATDLYLVVANWPEKRREHWRTLLRARAIENQAYVLGVNRIGEGSGLRYAGDSAIIDPWGAVLSEASKDPTTLLAEVDAARVADARAKFPVLGDRR
jgi:predicted amidohydrolase